MDERLLRNPSKFDADTILFEDSEAGTEEVTQNYEERLLEEPAEEEQEGSTKNESEEEIRNETASDGNSSNGASSETNPPNSSQTENQSIVPFSSLNPLSSAFTLLMNIREFCSPNLPNYIYVFEEQNSSSVFPDFYSLLVNYGLNVEFPPENVNIECSSLLSVACNQKIVVNLPLNFNEDTAFNARFSLVSSLTNDNILNPTDAFSLSNIEPEASEETLAISPAENEIFASEEMTVVSFLPGYESDVILDTSQDEINETDTALYSLSSQEISVSSHANYDNEDFDNDSVVSSSTVDTSFDFDQLITFGDSSTSEFSGLNEALSIFSQPRNDHIFSPTNCDDFDFFSVESVSSSLVSTQETTFDLSLSYESSALNEPYFFSQSESNYISQATASSDSSLLEDRLIVSSHSESSTTILSLQSNNRSLNQENISSGFSTEDTLIVSSNSQTFQSTENSSNIQNESLYASVCIFSDGFSLEESNEIYLKESNEFSTEENNEVLAEENNEISPEESNEISPEDSREVVSSGATLIVFSCAESNSVTLSFQSKNFPGSSEVVPLISLSSEVSNVASCSSSSSSFSGSENIEVDSSLQSLLTPDLSCNFETFAEITPGVSSAMEDSPIVSSDSFEEENLSYFADDLRPQTNVYPNLDGNSEVLSEILVDVSSSPDNSHVASFGPFSEDNQLVYSSLRNIIVDSNVQSDVRSNLNHNFEAPSEILVDVSSSLEDCHVASSGSFSEGNQSVFSNSRSISVDSNVQSDVRPNLNHNFEAPSEIIVNAFSSLEESHVVSSGLSSEHILSIFSKTRSTKVEFNFLSNVVQNVDSGFEVPSEILVDVSSFVEESHVATVGPSSDDNQQVFSNPRNPRNSGVNSNLQSRALPDLDSNFEASSEIHVDVFSFTEESYVVTGDRSSEDIQPVSSSGENYHVAFSGASLEDSLPVFLSPRDDGIDSSLQRKVPGDLGRNFEVPSEVIANFASSVEDTHSKSSGSSSEEILPDFLSPKDSEIESSVQDRVPSEFKSNIDLNSNSKTRTEMSCHAASTAEDSHVAASAGTFSEDYLPVFSCSIRSENESSLQNRVSSNLNSNFDSNSNFEAPKEMFGCVSLTEEAAASSGTSPEGNLPAFSGSRCSEINSRLHIRSPSDLNSSFDLKSKFDLNSNLEAPVEIFCGVFSTAEENNLNDSVMLPEVSNPEVLNDVSLSSSHLESRFELSHLENFSFTNNNSNNLLETLSGTEENTCVQNSVNGESFFPAEFVLDNSPEKIPHNFSNSGNSVFGTCLLKVVSASSNAKPKKEISDCTFGDSSSVLSQINTEAIFQHLQSKPENRTESYSSHLKSENNILDEDTERVYDVLPWDFPALLSAQTGNETNFDLNVNFPDGPICESSSFHTFPTLMIVPQKSTNGENKLLNPFNDMSKPKKRSRKNVGRKTSTPASIFSKSRISKRRSNKEVSSNGGAEETYICNACNRSFPKKRSLSCHRTLHCTKLALKRRPFGSSTNKTASCDSKPEKGSSKSSEPSFLCHICSEIFLKETSLICHIKSHSADEDLHVSPNGQSFTSFIDSQKDQKGLSGTSVTFSASRKSKEVKQEENAVVSDSSSTASLASSLSTLSCSSELLDKLQEEFKGPRFLKYICQTCFKSFETKQCLVMHQNLYCDTILVNAIRQLTRNKIEMKKRTEKNRQFRRNNKVLGSRPLHSSGPILFQNLDFESISVIPTHESGRNKRKIKEKSEDDRQIFPRNKRTKRSLPPHYSNHKPSELKEKTENSHQTFPGSEKNAKNSFDFKSIQNLCPESISVIPISESTRNKTELKEMTERCSQTFLGNKNAAGSSHLYSSYLKSLKLKEEPEKDCKTFPSQKSAVNSFDPKSFQNLYYVNIPVTLTCEPVRNKMEINETPEKGRRTLSSSKKTVGSPPVNSLDLKPLELKTEPEKNRQTFMSSKKTAENSSGLKPFQNLHCESISIIPISDSSRNETEMKKKHQTSTSKNTARSSFVNCSNPKSSEPKKKPEKSRQTLSSSQKTVQNVSDPKPIPINLLKRQQVVLGNLEHSEYSRHLENSLIVIRPTLTTPQETTDLPSKYLSCRSVPSGFIRKRSPLKSAVAEDNSIYLPTKFQSNKSKVAKPRLQKDRQIIRSNKKTLIQDLSKTLTNKPKTETLFFEPFKPSSSKPKMAIENRQSDHNKNIFSSSKSSIYNPTSIESYGEESLRFHPSKTLNTYSKTGNQNKKAFHLHKPTSFKFITIEHKSEEIQSSETAKAEDSSIYRPSAAKKRRRSLLRNEETPTADRLKNSASKLKPELFSLQKRNEDEKTSTFCVSEPSSNKSESRQYLDHNAKAFHATKPSGYKPIIIEFINERNETFETVLTEEIPVFLPPLVQSSHYKEETSERVLSKSLNDKSMSEKESHQLHRKKETSTGFLCKSLNAKSKSEVLIPEISQSFHQKEETLTDVHCKTLSIESKPKMLIPEISSKERTSTGALCKTLNILNVPKISCQTSHSKEEISADVLSTKSESEILIPEKNRRSSYLEEKTSASVLCNALTTKSKPEMLIPKINRQSLYRNEETSTFHLNKPLNNKSKPEICTSEVHPLHINEENQTLSFQSFEPLTKRRKLATITPQTLQQSLHQPEETLTNLSPLEHSNNISERLICTAEDALSYIPLKPSCNPSSISSSISSSRESELSKLLQSKRSDCQDSLFSNLNKETLAFHSLESPKFQQNFPKLTREIGYDSKSTKDSLKLREKDCVFNSTEEISALDFMNCYRGPLKPSTSISISEHERLIYADKDASRLPFKPSTSGLEVTKIVQPEKSQSLFGPSRPSTSSSVSEYERFIHAYKDDTRIPFKPSTNESKLAKIVQSERSQSLFRPSRLSTSNSVSEYQRLIYANENGSRFLRPSTSGSEMAKIVQSERSQSLLDPSRLSTSNLVPEYGSELPCKSSTNGSELAKVVQSKRSQSLIGPSRPSTNNSVPKNEQFIYADEDDSGFNYKPSTSGSELTKVVQSEKSQTLLGPSRPSTSNSVPEYGSRLAFKSSTNGSELAKIVQAERSQSLLGPSRSSTSNSVPENSSRLPFKSSTNGLELTKVVQSEKSQTLLGPSRPSTSKSILEYERFIYAGENGSRFFKPTASGSELAKEVQPESQCLLGSSRPSASNSVPKNERLIYANEERSGFAFKSSTSGSELAKAVFQSERSQSLLLNEETSTLYVLGSAEHEQDILGLTQEKGCVSTNLEEISTADYKNSTRSISEIIPSELSTDHLTEDHPVEGPDNSSRLRALLTSSVKTLNCDSSTVTHEGQFENNEEKCPICQKTFNNKLSLMVHQKVHHQESIYPCCVCGKIFETEDFLSRHLLTHVKDKPYSCGICDRTFEKFHYLKCHLVIHQEETPFTCLICLKRFKTKSGLTIHLKAHQEMICITCMRQFESVEELNTHQQVQCKVGSTAANKNKVKRYYECKDCGRKFSCKRYLNTHVFAHL